jgi:predicted translin family RNA/ssDNA-binding protein
MSARATLPVRPSAVMESFGVELQELLAKEMQEMQDETIAADEMRDGMFRSTRNLSKNTGKIQFAVRTGGQGGVIDALVEENKRIIGDLIASTSSDPMQRAGGGALGNAIQSFTETRMMQHFFETGALASPSTVGAFCNDEEYIGAALGFAQELSRYAVGRACENDTASIALCRRLIVQLNTKLLEFDFRNGPLRRKYDGLKYALKNIEDITYELSLLEDAPVSAGGEGGGEETHASKKRKADSGSVTGTDGSSATAAAAAMDTSAEAPAANTEAEAEVLDLICVSEIDSIKVRMDAYDKLREQVIKDTRDVQKLSKQGIFSVHRGNLKAAKAQLDDAQAKAKAILALIADQPTLRQGSLSNCIEEWAEGMLTLHWAQHQKVLSKQDLVICNTTEYVGALSDFTGEIGRLAVASASKRDFANVRYVHQADVAISAGLMQINVGGKYSKKVEAVTTNLRKVEDIVYELSMLRRGGKGRAREEEAPRDAAAGAGGDGE